MMEVTDMSDENKKTTQMEFKAEVKQLLNILVHSLYTNREIFLRELVSNASDALDKLRFESTKGTDIADPKLPFEININFDSKKKIITVMDTGIGMTKDELITNLGTIAKSGSADFIEKLNEGKDSANNIIGKFGVGFYSVFMVAKEVIVKTKSASKDELPMLWKSDGLGSYELQPLDEKIKRGTTIEIHLKEDAEEFADKFRLQQIVKKYSNFISFPINVDKEHINTISALWREPKSSITKDQYKDFYKFLTYDTEDPFEVIHKSIDAPIQFSALLFIPKKNLDIFGFSRDEYGLDLYVRRVLIQHKTKDILPEYLSFVKGVVDSEDLPLNISRETLQENIIFTKISTSVTSQVLSGLEKIAKDEPARYTEFWLEHSKILKMGYSDFANREKFMRLLRYNSSKSEDEKTLTSLEEYVSRMKKEQKEIYYASGSSREALKLDPHLEIFNRKGLEVLFLYDPADEFVINSLQKFEDYQFISVDQADLTKVSKLENIEEKKTEFEDFSADDKMHFDSLLARIKAILGDKVKEVKISDRLTDSPACLVNPEDAMSSTMQKILRVSQNDKTIPQKIMEINKDHLLIRNLLKIFKKDSSDKYIDNVVEQLYESSLLLEGFLSDPHKLVNRINDLLKDSSDWYVKVKEM